MEKLQSITRHTYGPPPEEGGAVTVGDDGDSDSGKLSAVHQATCQEYFDWYANNVRKGVFK